MQRFVEHLDHHTSLMEALKIDFCRKAAAFADCRRHEEFGSPNAVEWISSNFNMTAADAASCIALGRYLAAVDAHRAARGRPMAPSES